MESVSNKAVICLIFLLFLLVSAPLAAEAETRTITAVGEYTTGEGETISVGKERALVLAKQSAAEQAGVYIESYSKSGNLVLTTDEAKVLAYGTVEVISASYDEPQKLPGGYHLRVTITAAVNTDNIEQQRKNLGDKSLVSDLKQAQASYNDIQSEITLLQKLLLAAVGDQKNDIIQRIIKNETRFSAAQWFERGNLAALRKDYNSAVEAFNKSIDINPQNGNAYNNRGKAYADLNQYEQAIADYDKAIALNPKDAYAYNNRGIAYKELKQIEKAIADYDKAISIDPGIAAAYAHRGEVYKSLNQYSKAISDFDKALAIDPLHADVYTNRGNAYGLMNNYTRAIADYDKAISIEPRNGLAYYNRGMANMMLKNYEQAVSDCDHAIALDSKMVDAYFYRGYSYGRLSQFNRALADFDQVIAINPKYIKAYFGRGFALGCLNRRQEAIDALSLFIRYSDDPNGIAMAKGMIRDLGGTP